MRLSLLPLLLLLLTACNSCTSTKSDTSDVKRPIAEVLASHTNTWMAIPGVVGTGETEQDGAPAVMIMVDQLTDSLRAKLPKEVEGYPVVLDEVGTIRANPKE